MDGYLGSQVLQAGLHLVIIRVFHNQVRQEEAEAGPEVVQHLADGGGGHPLAGGEPGGRHSRWRWGDDNAGNSIEQRPQVTEQGEVRLGEGGNHQEQTADRGAQGYQAAGQEDGVAEAPVLQVEHGEHEHQESDGRPVSKERDGALGPGGEDKFDHVHYWSPGIPHTALEHGQQREHCRHRSHNNWR